MLPYLPDKAKFTTGLYPNVQLTLLKAVDALSLGLFNIQNLLCTSSQFHQQQHSHYIAVSL